MGLTGVPSVVGGIEAVDNVAVWTVVDDVEEWQVLLLATRATNFG